MFILCDTNFTNALNYFDGHLQCDYIHSTTRAPFLQNVQKTEEYVLTSLYLTLLEIFNSRLSKIYTNGF